MGLGEPPCRAYSHSDVSGTCRNDVSGNAHHTRPILERAGTYGNAGAGQFRSDLCLERGNSGDTNNSVSGGNSEIRITENFNTLQR